jgi:hypothetical protein
MPPCPVVRILSCLAFKPAAVTPSPHTLLASPSPHAPPPRPPPAVFTHFAPHVPPRFKVQATGSDSSSSANRGVSGLMVFMVVAFFLSWAVVVVLESLKRLRAYREKVAKDAAAGLATPSGSKLLRLGSVVVAVRTAFSRSFGRGGGSATGGAPVGDGVVGVSNPLRRDADALGRRGSPPHLLAASRGSHSPPRQGRGRADQSPPQGPVLSPGGGHRGTGSAGLPEAKGIAAGSDVFMQANPLREAGYMSGGGAGGGGGGGWDGGASHPPPLSLPTGAVGTSKGGGSASAAAAAAAGLGGSAARRVSRPMLLVRNMSQRLRAAHMLGGRKDGPGGGAGGKSRLRFSQANPPSPELLPTPGPEQGPHPGHTTQSQESPTPLPH